MRGPHPFPERPRGDVPALREILAALDEQHARAASAGWPTLRAALAMAIGAGRDDLARAEAAAPRPATRPAGMLRRLGGED